MTLGKRHVIGMLPLLAAAVAYNIWYFTKGADTPASRPVEPPVTAIATSGPSVAGEASAPIDPTAIPPVMDVALDRVPEWQRNPFVDPRQPSKVVDVEPVRTAPSEPEPAIVVSAIFMSSDGRRAHAKVNGRTVRVGDRVGSATVVDIQQKTIVIESPTFGRRTIGPASPPPPRLRQGSGEADSASGLRRLGETGSSPTAGAGQ